MARNNLLLLGIILVLSVFVSAGRTIYDEDKGGITWIGVNGTDNADLTTGGWTQTEGTTIFNYDVVGVGQDYDGDGTKIVADSSGNPLYSYINSSSGHSYLTVMFYDDLDSSVNYNARPCNGCGSPSVGIQVNTGVDPDKYIVSASVSSVSRSKGWRNFTWSYNYTSGNVRAYIDSVSVFNAGAPVNFDIQSIGLYTDNACTNCSYDYIQFWNLSADIFVDTTAPNITLINFTSDGGTSCLNNSIIFPTNCANTTDTTPTFGITVDEISACRMGVGTEVIYTSLNISCSAAAGNLTHTCTQDVALPFGWHNFNFICIDAVGNNRSLPLLSNYKANLTITNVPTVLYNTPSTSAGNQTTDFIYMDMTATTPLFTINNISHFLYNFNNGALLSFNSTITSPSVSNFSNLADGNYTVIATATDTGNFTNSSVSRTIRIDRTLPRVNFTFSSFSAGNLTTPYINITVLIGDVHFAIANISWYNTILTFGTFLNSSSTVNSSLDTFSVNTSFADGNYSVNVTARDTFDNQNVTETRNYTIDTIFPTIDFRSDSTSAGNTTHSYINITVNANDVHQDNTSVFLHNTTQLLNITSFSGSIATLNVSLRDGTYNYNATAYDTFDHANSTATREVTIDTIFPIIQFEDATTPAGDWSLTFIQVNVTASDTRLTNITIFLYNATEVRNITINASSPSFVNYTDLTSGTYYVNATAYDTHGHANSTSTRTYI